ncbi:MAG TPA: hypothetical protein VEB65_06465 [Solirubrobacterales bacterium]|nr:hypothetical protein [Solirubrobacterales bacterium]
MNALLNAALGLIPLADWHHDGPGWWFLFPLFWILLIAGLFFLFRRRGPWGNPRYHQPRESAAELLERRFAAGEITSDEYRERRSVLDPPERS